MIVLRRGLRLRRGIEGRDRDEQAGHGDRQGASASGATSADRAASRRLHLHFYAKPRRGRRRPTAVDGVPVRAHRAGWRGRRPRHRRDPRGRRAGGLPRGRLLRVAARGHPVRREARRHPEPRGPGARRGRHRVMPGVYATGWIKRGPVGLIGHTKSDAMETIEHLVNDQANWWSPARSRGGSRRRRCSRAAVSSTRPRRLAQPRRSTRSRSASPQGRARIKVVPRDEMVAVSNKPAG